MMDRHFVFKNHAYLSIGAFVLSLVGVSLFGEVSWELTGAILVASLGFSYFCQQQKLAEILLFKELFTEFNARYDRLNDHLTDIKAIPADGTLDDHQTKRLADYFNLCAEEFLFRQEGYIPDVVWRAWCAGMQEHLEHPLIRIAWERESTTGSHYGLTSEDIEAGARLSLREHA